MNGHQISASREGLTPLRITRNCVLDVMPLIAGFAMSRIVVCQKT